MRLAVLFPEMLGTYGDIGNAVVLARRLEWRGIPVEVSKVPMGQPIPSSCDIYVLGGGEDLAQVEAARVLAGSVEFGAAAAAGAVIFGVCAGLQLLGETFSGPSHAVSAGAGLIDVASTRLPRRAVGEITVEVAGLGLHPLTGFENHAGGTTLGPDCQPLGRVLEGVGNGDGFDGAQQGRIIGTYLHGPVLARNPDLADLLLSWALARELPPLDLPEVAELRNDRLGRRGTG